MSIAPREADILDRQPEGACLPAESARIVNGAEAMGIAYWLAGARIAYTFPITPQSEVIDYFGAHPDIECIRADSEYNVIAGAEGVLWGGERCAIATSSQGLILMSEVMWEVAGNRLPMVMGVFNRGLKGPGWCLGSQQNDALFMRDTGWLQFYCESAQEILDFTLIAHKLAERLALPVMIVGDGFYLSHELEEVCVPDPDSVRRFVGEPDWPGMPFNSVPASYGALVPPDQYSKFYRTLHEDVNRSVGVFDEIAGEFEHLFGRRHGLTAAHHTDDAEIVIVTAGTISGTAMQVVNDLRRAGEKVGLLKLHAFRPFPTEQVIQHLSRASRILLLDRNIAPGLGGIFTGQLRTALQLRQVTTPVFGMVTGLGGLDVTPQMVETAVRYVQAATDLPAEALFLDEDGVS